MEFMYHVRRNEWLNRWAKWIWDLIEALTLFVGVLSWQIVFGEYNPLFYSIGAIFIGRLQSYKERFAPATFIAILFQLFDIWKFYESKNWVELMMAVIIPTALVAFFQFWRRASLWNWIALFTAFVAELGLHVPFVTLREVIQMLIAAILLAFYQKERLFRSKSMRELEIDPLTEVCNRRGCQSWLDTWQGQVGKCLMLDIDEFKFVNDSFGHEVGDQVLREISRRLQAVVGTHGAIVRWGGDEFLILIPHRSEAESLTDLSFATTLHRKLTDAPLWVEALGTNLTLRVSIGVAIGELSLSLVDQADQALLDIKRSSKNRVGLFVEARQDRGISSMTEARMDNRQLDWVIRALTPLMERAEFGFVVTGLDHRILSVNRAYETLSGYSRDDLIGQRPKLLASQLRNNDAHYAALRQDLTTLGNWKGEFYNHRPDNTEWVAYEWITVIEMGGERLGYWGIVSEKQTLWGRDE